MGMLWAVGGYLRSTGTWGVSWDMLVAIKR